MRRTREQWAALVAAFERTSQPVGQFCAKREISPRTFAWWRWKVREIERSRSHGVKLLPVDVVESSAPPTTLTIAVLDDVELRVEVGADVEYVATLVARLRHA